MPQFTNFANDNVQLAAKLKSGIEASNAKLKADLQVLSGKTAPSAPATRRDVAPAPRVTRRSPNLRRFAALVCACLLIVGIAFVAVRWAGNWDQAPAARSEAVIPPPLGTIKRMDAIRDSFTKH